jgi:hypothetical protein
VAEPTYCSDISRSLGESLCGTASRVRAWLLIEEPGDWGRDAVVQSALGEELGRALKQATAPHGIRILLLRRPDGTMGARPHCFLGFSGMDDRWILHLDIDSPRDIVDMDLSPIANGDRPLFGTEWEEPIYLVCTHGQHDSCCGRLGPPIARSLDSFRPEKAWQASHVGGDRFAANLVCLPHGLYFGRVDDARRIVGLVEKGAIDLMHYRGRSCYEPVVQAAEIMVRGRYGIRGIDDIVPIDRADHDDGISTVTFHTSSGEELSQRVKVVRGEKRRLTCSATNPGRPRVFLTVPPEGPSVLY